MLLADLLVDALATHRIVRLVQRDTLPPVARARGHLLATHPHHPLVELLVCPWCASIHAAALTQVLRLAAPRAWRVLGVVLAASSAAGFLTELEDR